MELLFERYQPKKKLGEGGFAEVWLAEDLNQKREVALKILKQLDETSKFRFKKEYHILSKLNNLGIVKVFEYLQNSHILYSMEFIKGKNIRDYLFSYDWTEGEREGPYYIHRDGIEKALEIFYQTASTLHYIHSENIIHRDLKPENIFFDEVNDYVKILDFGLVKEELSIQQTQKDLIQGTPAYISPEYIKGKEIDLRADLYALGVIFYELLTGRLPFSSSSIMLLLESHLKQIPKPPTFYNSLIPDEMEEIILKLLEKEPQRRFAYAIEVAQKIKKVMESFKRGEEKKKTREEKTIAIEPKLPEQLFVAPWIGKKEELKRAFLSVERLNQKQGGILTIEGEHGSGKSRFAEEIKSKAIENGFEVFSALSKEEVPYPFYLFEKIVSQFLKKYKKILMEEGEIILQFFPEIQKEIEKTEEFGTIPQIDPKGEKARLFYSFYSIIKNLSEKKPLVFLFDDLQWADPSSLELLNHLIYMLCFSENPLPVLFCLSYTPEEVSEENKNILFKYKNKSEIIVLKPFNLEELQEFVQSLLYNPEPLPLSFLEILLNQTGGNPLFIMETVKALIDEGFLKRQTGRINWIIASYKDAQRATMTLQKLALPETIKENLKLRLRKYNEKELAILQNAALIGKKFPFVLWHKISDITEDELLNLAEKLLKDRILKELPNEILEFYNDQIRKILIEEISGLKKRRVQGKIANAILSFYKEVPEELYLTLAQSLEASDRGREAKVYYKKLAAKHFKVYDLIQAEELWKKVLSFSEGKEKAESLKNLGDIMAYSGRYEEAKNYYLEGINISSPLEEEYFDLKISLGSLYSQMGDYKKTAEIFDEINKELDLEKMEKQLGWVYYYKGIINYSLGNQTEAINFFKESLKIFEKLENVEGILAIYGSMGAPYFISGKTIEAENIFKEGLKLSSKYGDFRRKLLCLSNLISLKLNLGNYEEMDEYFKEALNLSSSIGDLRIYSHILYIKGLFLKRKKELKESIDYLEKAKDLSLEISAKEVYCDSLVNLSTALIEEGVLEKAKNYLNQTREIAFELNYLVNLNYIDFLINFLKFLEGNKEACKKMEEKLKEIKEKGDPYDFVECSIYFAKALKNLNENEKAKECLQEALEIAEEKNYNYLVRKIEEEFSGIN